MADIRISSLPNEPAPSGADFVAIDLASTRRTTVTLLTEAGRPTASQAEAEAGTDPTKAMTPLTVKQAITFQGSASFQPLDADLTTIAAFATTGVLARTGAGTWSLRTVTGTANQIGVTNGDGVAGNPTLALAGTPASLAGLSLVAGDILYATGANTLQRLPIGSTAQVLQVISGVPTWNAAVGTGDVSGPASAVTGRLAVFNGATGKVIADSSSVLAADVVTGPASVTASSMAEFNGTTGKLLQSGGVVVSAFMKTVFDDATAVAALTTLGITSGSTTPVPTAGSGTITTASSRIDYTRITNCVMFTATVTVTTNGTGASFINLTLPFTASQAGAASGRNGTTSVDVTGVVGVASNNMTFVTGTGTYPIASGQTFTVSGVFFV